jgi:excinuclease UvrABC nuclease subunit
MMQTAIWNGYKFEVCEPFSRWSAASGIYIFAGSQSGKWLPIYIGQAISFQQRFSNHEKWEAAQRLGMTHIHATAVNHQGERDRIERDLIQTFNPRLNVQLART